MRLPLLLRTTFPFFFADLRVAQEDNPYDGANHRFLRKWIASRL